MNRRLGVGVGVVVVAVALLVWRCRSTDDAKTSGTKPTTSAAANQASAAQVGVTPKAKLDPRTQAKGSIAGTIRDEQKRPIAGATVCMNLYSSELPPDFWKHGECKTADANGAYAWPELFVAGYVVTATARGYRFASHHPKKDNREATLIKLGPGEHKTAVDVILHAGGVEITGVVNDISGGPIAHARVTAAMGRWGEGGVSPAVETDEKGAFALWVPPGSLAVNASADGYAAGEQRGRAPGTFEVLLTPEGSLSGTVVDARTNAPIEGVDVRVERTQWEGFLRDSSERTDASGAFRIDGLSPGRYTAKVHGKQGYGVSEGSTLIGLGQHVGGVVVRVFPTARVIGKVIVGATKAVCPDASITMRDEANERWVSGSADDDGTITIEGVLPGTYAPRAWCRGKLSKDDYDKIVVAEKDITGLTLEVDDAAVISGRVLTKSGAPVADAHIMAQLIGGEARAKQDYSQEQSEVDGTYELLGLKGATYKLDLTTDAGVPDKDGYKVDAKTGQTVTKDLILDDGGTLTGTVIDEDGKPVPNISINANLIDSQDFMFWGDAPNKSDAAGAFTITGLRAGDYRVTASRGWAAGLRKPGTTDDAKQGEKTKIEAGKTSTVRLVVESQSGTIKGVVIDPDGKPVSDAFISNARESDAAGAGSSSAHGTRGYGWGEERPVLTGTDGSFTVTNLAPGKYTLRAFRKGGGEALAEHVVVGTTTAKLQIKTTGSLEGVVTVKGGSAPDQFQVRVEDVKTGFERSETFFRTAGRFSLRDLPSGHFHLTVTAANGSAKTELDLASGENKTGVTIELESLVTLTGRMVDFTTKAPVSGIRVSANLAQGGVFSFMNTEDMDNTSDETGRFAVKRTPRGKLSVQGMAKEFETSDYQWFRVLRDITTSTGDTVDVGDLPIIKRRVKDGDAVGELGINFKEQPPEVPDEQRELRVSFIEPDGAAAKSEIKVGDVIITVDGVNVTGGDSLNAWTLMQAPPGTKLVLGLARGAQVTITLAPPS